MIGHTFAPTVKLFISQHNTDLFIYKAQWIFLTGILQSYGRSSLETQKPHD